MILLPSVSDLIKRTKALAALDLIMSPEWDMRYYSFNTNWSPQEQMASMRNGSGDEWWIVFHDSGWVALKGLDHESPAWSKGRAKLSKALQDAIPHELQSFANEPAFCWDATSFAYFCVPPNEWKRANDLTQYANIGYTGEEWTLALLSQGPAAYVEFAEEYYEKSIPLSSVSMVYSLSTIGEHLVNSLNPEVSLSQISPELLNEIGYPRTA
jgi:hypothetical protein